MEKIIKLIILTLVNFYNASEQKSLPIKQSLHFIGTVNLLAVANIVFDF